MVSTAGITDEEGAPESLLLLCWSLLLPVGAIDGDMARLPTLVAFSWLIEVCGVTSAPVVAFLVEDLVMGGMRRS